MNTLSARKSGRSRGHLAEALLGLVSCGCTPLVDLKVFGPDQEVLLDWSSTAKSASQNLPAGDSPPKVGEKYDCRLTVSSGLTDSPYSFSFHGQARPHFPEITPSTLGVSEPIDLIIAVVILGEGDNAARVNEPWLAALPRVASHSLPCVFRQRPHMVDARDIEAMVKMRQALRPNSSFQWQPGGEPMRLPFIATEGLLLLKWVPPEPEVDAQLVAQLFDFTMDINSLMNNASLPGCYSRPLVFEEYVELDRKTPAGEEARVLAEAFAQLAASLQSSPRFQRYKQVIAASRKKLKALWPLDEKDLAATDKEIFGTVPQDLAQGNSLAHERIERGFLFSPRSPAQAPDTNMAGRANPEAPVPPPAAPPPAAPPNGDAASPKPNDEPTRPNGNPEGEAPPPGPSGDVGGPGGEGRTTASRAGGDEASVKKKEPEAQQ